MIRRKLLATLTITALALPGIALAQAYPDRPIKVMQGFAPGGNADNIARTVGLEMSKGLGQNIVVEAQAGAGGTIAANQVAKANPDGYTLLVHSSGHVVNPAIYPNLPYDTLNDLVGITSLASLPNVMVVSPSKGFKDVKDLIAKVKAKPKPKAKAKDKAKAPLPPRLLRLLSTASLWLILPTASL
mgnify:CR=1 FL=1